MSEIRLHELKKLLKNCNADLIFVTAFLKREDFRKWSVDIAWETEVWIADNPDHLIHFNGSKFLGPYKNKE
jgi:type II restriction enzyme